MDDNSKISIKLMENIYEYSSKYKIKYDEKIMIETPKILIDLYFDYFKKCTKLNKKDEIKFVENDFSLEGLQNLIDLIEKIHPYIIFNNIDNVKINIDVLNILEIIHICDYLLISKHLLTKIYKLLKKKIFTEDFIINFCSYFDNLLLGPLAYYFFDNILNNIIRHEICDFGLHAVKKLINYKLGYDCIIKKLSICSDIYKNKFFMHLINIIDDDKEKYFENVNKLLDHLDYNIIKPSSLKLMEHKLNKELKVIPRDQWINSLIDIYIKKEYTQFNQMCSTIKCSAYPFEEINFLVNTYSKYTFLGNKFIIGIYLNTAYPIDIFIKLNVILNGNIILKKNKFVASYLSKKIMKFKLFDLKKGDHIKLIFKELYFVKKKHITYRPC